jgi:hypothetical protein
MEWKIDDYYFRLEASCVVFGYVLRRRFDSVRSRVTNPQDALNIFDADKTIRLINKLWDHREQDQESRLPHFPVADQNDKHGTRVAFDAGDRVENRVAVIDAMVAFDRVCNPANRTILVDEIPFDWGVQKLIRPQVTAASLTRLISQGFILESDVEFIESYAESTRPLESDQIIALGRHENSQNTRVSVLYEFGRWVHWTRLCLESLARITADSGEKAIRSAAHFAWHSWTFAEECVKKAHTEQKIYDGARSRITEAGDEETRVLRAFRICQPDGNSIWKSNDVKPLVFPACFCDALSVYLIGSLARQEPFTGCLKGLPITADEWVKAYNRLLCFASLEPSHRPYEFDPDTNDLPLERVQFRIYSPSQIEQGSVDFGQMARSLTDVLEHAYSRYLSSDLMGLRIN